MKNFDINQHHPLITAYHILITTKVIHPIVGHLPGLLLLGVLFFFVSAGGCVRPDKEQEDNQEAGEGGWHDR